jgi:transcriptional regulator with XRE-family HTH domain
VSEQQLSLATARTAAKLSTEELARKARVDTKMIASIEEAQAENYVWSLDHATATKIAGALGHQLNVLFEGWRLTATTDQRGVTCHQCHMIIEPIHRTVCSNCNDI